MSRTPIASLGVDSHGSEHTNIAVPRVHEQRLSRHCCLINPYTAMSLPYDILYTILLRSTLR